ncbi:MAG TPA: PD-(D/E)XK nuclease family protein [Polyangiaceae bacterium]|nr:PD-(D/E)XK nuclease family protein [Polyangiaceae bacterium]
MHPFVGLELSGASLTPVNDLEPGTGRLGAPVWGPEELLRDLELRLGIPQVEQDSSAVRVTRWAERIAPLAAAGRYYSSSFKLDPIGTARALLSLRDELVLTGWDGGPVADAGYRVDALVEIESVETPLTLPRDFADRLAQVQRELREVRSPIYDQITLAEEQAAWSGLWQRVFEALRRHGTHLDMFEENFQGAPPDSDLGVIQAALSGKSASPRPPLRGDGTFLMLESETSLEAASVSAAIIAALGNEPSAVIRDGNDPALAHALLTQGVPPQGLHSSSRWRSALQVLPLALELAFEPKDPHRVLDLLSLPRGPFRGAVRRRLLRALVRSPGIGGRAWQEAKERFPEPASAALTLVADWFERPGADPIRGATTEALLEVVDRVRTWLSEQIALSPDDEITHAALRHCTAFVATLTERSGAAVDLVTVRRLVEFVAGGGMHLELQRERAGRVDYVSSAGALLVPRSNVLWWSFTHGYDKLTHAWRKGEHAALLAAGLWSQSAEQRFAARAARMRRAVQAATKRLLLVAPKTVAGDQTAAHPLWDEIIARLRPLPSELAAITRTAANFLEAGSTGLPELARQALLPRELPVARPIWHLNVVDSPPVHSASANSLTALLGCPLQWTLANWAGLASVRLALPAMHLLNGNLGHRLIEELHSQGAFSEPAERFRHLAIRQMESLLSLEGAVLLRAGKAYERDQLQAQLVDAACALQRTLFENELELLDAEKPFAVPWRAGELRGRWDLVARSNKGQLVIIDLKWGDRKYRDKLRAANDLQLPAYTHALRLEHADVSAVYFSLSSRKLFGARTEALSKLEVVPGPPAHETWRRVERTAQLAEQAIAAGAIHVTGLRTSLPLLESLEIEEAGRSRHFAVKPEDACEYCGFDAICGRRWGEVS